MPPLRPSLCAECSEPLPPPRPRGRPRRFCSDACRYANKAHRSTLTSWHAAGDDDLAAMPLDPLTLQRRSLACVAEMLDGRPPAPAEDQLVQALIELHQIAYTLRRLEPDLPRRLAARSGALARDLHAVLVEHFPHLEESTA